MSPEMLHEIDPLLSLFPKLDMAVDGSRNQEIGTNRVRSVISYEAAYVVT